MQLTSSEFCQLLAEFVNQFNTSSKDKWTLCKSPHGISAKQSVMVKWRKEVVNRQVYITYNNVYEVPVLWFNVYKRDGTPLTVPESLELCATNNSLELSKNISLNEHPTVGMLFHNIHPCHTAKLMDELNGEGNYIAKWLSIYGSAVGLFVPDSLFSPVSSHKTSLIHSSSDAEQSSEEGSV